MSLFAYIIIFSFLWAVLWVLIASIFLLLKKEIQKKAIKYMLSYATWILLSASFIWLLPKLISIADIHRAMITVVLSIFLFFFVEKILLWRHCHDESCKWHLSTVWMIIIGDWIHNFLDGILIWTSFLISIPLGITTTVWVIIHEIPQELGDFAIFLHSWLSAKKSLIYNLASNLTTVLWAILVYLFQNLIEGYKWFIIALAVASFVYISLVDLTPQLHKKTKITDTLLQILFMIAGLITVLLLVH